MPVAASTSGAHTRLRLRGGVLEGIVCKRPTSRYLAGQRGWLKLKNRDYWRFPHDSAGARETRRPRLGEYALV